MRRALRIFGVGLCAAVIATGSLAQEDIARIRGAQMLDKILYDLKYLNPVAAPAPAPAERSRAISEHKKLLDELRELLSSEHLRDIAMAEKFTELVNLVDDPWAQSIVIYILGKIGPSASSAIPKLYELQAEHERMLERSGGIFIGPWAGCVLVDALKNIGGIVSEKVARGCP